MRSHTRKLPRPRLLLRFYHSPILKRLRGPILIIVLRIVRVTAARMYKSSIPKFSRLNIVSLKQYQATPQIHEAPIVPPLLARYVSSADDPAGPVLMDTPYINFRIYKK